MRNAPTVVVLTAIAAVVLAQPEPEGGAQRRGRAIEGLAQSSGDDALRQFAETHLAPSYREQFAAADLLARLRALREACSDFGGVMVRPAGGNAFEMTFLKGPTEVLVQYRVEPAPPHRIVALELQSSRASGRERPAVEPLTWDTLEPRLAQAETSGFTGTVLVARGGQVVLHKGYGLANREKRIRNTTSTIFAIGSVPIDFTRGAILRLEQDGRLRTTDPLSKFVAEVPEDKRSITLDHLMSGRSGLPDFHHVQGVDADFDLSWIDRAEAIRRILRQDLLFRPGEGRAHSHSAWVMLAAVVELVSQQTYATFLRERFFGPAGMTRTGHHEEGSAFADDEFAVGYEGRPVGSPNIPKNWGRTSWLVMGSGGMQSNPHDLYRWLQATRGGKTLSAAASARYDTKGVSIGGDDRGFYCLQADSGVDLVILCSNAHAGPGDYITAVARRLAELVTGGG